MAKDASELTAKQRRFADEYLIDLNATAAYKRAGYVGKGNTAEVCASQLLSNPKVAEYVRAAMDKRSDDLGIDARYVLTTIKDTIERCSQAKPVFDKSGKPVMVEDAEGALAQAYVFDAGAVLKGAELLGKHLKMFTDKTELSGKDGGALVVEITRFSDAK